MAQYSINAYDADVYIPEFRGLMQYGDQMGSDLRFSPDCMNVETPAGVLQPVCKQEGACLCDGDSVVIGGNAGTFMRLRQTKAYSASTIPTHRGGADVSYQQGVYDIYVLMQGSHAYYTYILEDLKESQWYSLSEYEAPSGTVWDQSWSWTTYEESVELIGTYNVLLMSNKDKGMYSLRSNALSKVTTPANFSYIARFAERIWGISGDTLYYSRPFSTSDWTQDNTDPANGGGEIREPTFDDDHIVGMKTLGDALIVFSQRRAWRITGSDPSNFSIQEQIGNGTKYPDTIVTIGERIIMLGDEGLLSYDGYHVTPLMQQATHEIFKDGFIHTNDTDLFVPGIVKGRSDILPTATRIGNKYVLALNNEIGDQTDYSYGINEAGVIEPSSVSYHVGRGYRTLVYDTVDGTITQMSTPQILSFCEGTPYYIAYFEGAAPGDTGKTYPTPSKKTYNKIMRLRFDSWNERRPTAEATKWVSPWVTLGRQDVKKGGFDFYFTPEIAPAAIRQHQLWQGNSAGAFPNNERPSIFETEDAAIADTKVTFKISIQTEKKTKTKRYTVNSMTAAQLAADRKYKMKRLHFGGAGRRFRVIIETEVGNTTPWRLVGGIHIIAEIDKD